MRTMTTMAALGLALALGGCGEPTTWRVQIELDGKAAPLPREGFASFESRATCEAALANLLAQHGRAAPFQGRHSLTCAVAPGAEQRAAEARLARWRRCVADATRSAEREYEQQRETDRPSSRAQVESLERWHADLERLSVAACGAEPTYKS